MERTILHCDMNSFYASVELLARPELRGKPMAVCGDPENRHGIILAKTEEAKTCGVVTAETVWQARKKCPNLILVKPHHERYREYSTGSTRSMNGSPTGSNPSALTNRGWMYGKP
jgi:DNA polymerase-4